MKINARVISRNATVLLTVFAVGVTSVMPANASAPTDSSSTTSVAPSTTAANGTTTTAADGTTTTTSPDGATTTTVPGLTDTSVLPLYDGPVDKNGIDQPPTEQAKPDTKEFPAGKEGENKSGADLSAAANLVGPAIPGYVYMGIVYVTNIGNAVAGEKSPVSFTLEEMPTFVKLLDATPVLGADSVVGDRGWDCKGTQCVLVEKTDKGIVNALLASGATAQADLRFDIASDAVIPVPPADLLEKIKAASTGGDLAAFNAAVKQVTHLSAVANTAGDINTKNNEAVVQLNGVEQDSGVQAGSTRRVKSALGVNGQGIAGVFIESKIKGPVYPGGPFHMELRFLPTGTEVQSGSIKFSNVVAPFLALTKVKISGEGWKCDSETAPKSCTRTGADIKPGTYTDPLIIDARIGKTAPVAEKPQSWVLSANSTTALDATPIEASQTLSIDVRDVPEPDATIRLAPRDEQSSISPPGSVVVDAHVRSVYGPAMNARIKLSMRKGLVFKGLASDAEGWTCTSSTPEESAGEGATGQECVKPEIESETPEIVGFTISATEDTEAGTAQVIAEISADNEAAKYKDANRVAHTLVIQPQAAPMPGVELSRADDKGAVKVVSDGSATKIRIGQSQNYSFSTKNLGSKALAAGEIVRFEQFVDSTATFSGPAFAKSAGYSASLDSQKINTSAAGKWACVTGTGNIPQIASPLDAAKAATASSVAPVTTVATKKSGPAVRCEIKLASAVAPDKSTPVLNLSVKMANSAKVGTPEWPVYVTMLGVPAAPIARFGMTVAISEDTTDLVPSFLAPAGPRPGGKAVATLSLRNSGDTDAKAQFVVVPGIKDGRITGVSGESWKCARLGTALSSGFTICSRTPALKAGAETPALSLSYESTSKSSKTLNLQAASLYGTSRNIAAGRGSNLSVDLRPALAFNVKGPDSVIDQIVDAKGNRVASTVLLTTEGNGDGAAYVWKQLCTTDADVKKSAGECKSVTPAVKWADNKTPNGPSALFSAPVVTADTTLLFEVTASEAGSSSTARASVVVIPLPTVEGPTGKSSGGAGSSVLRRVPQQSVSARGVVRATAPTSGTGDATYSPLTATGVTVNGNVFGAKSVTVAQSAAVSLTASATGVGAITYAWSQASGPTPSVIASATTNAAALSFTAPATNVTVTLRVEATDSRGVKATDFITVTIGSGGAPVVSASITGAEGPVVVDTSQAFTLTAVGSGSGTLSYAWTQVSGTPLTLNNAAAAAVTVAATGALGDAVLQVVVTDGTGAKASAEVSLELKPGGAPAALCKFVEAASNKTLSSVQSTLDAIGIGGLDLTKFTVASSTCLASSKVSFSGAGFSLGSFLTVSDASGSVSGYGLTIRTARFTGPADWGAPQFAIAATDAVGLFIPFTGAGASVGAFEGEIIAAAMPFLKLPAGYTSSAALRFSVDAAGVKAMSLDANATGTPVNGKTPSARVYGAIATNGTFTLDGSMTDAVDLFGTVVNFAGKVTKATPTATTTVALSGSLVGPVTLTTGVVLNALSASRNEQGIVTGSGTVTVGTAPSALELTADLSYTDTKNHSLTVKATTANSSWTAAKDVVIPLASASGSYTNVNGARDIAITVVGSNSTPMTGLAIKTPTIAATAKCAADAACAVALKLTADAEITLGSTATTGKLEGNFDIAAKSGSFTATIGSIPVVAGLQLTTASLAIQATKVGAADQATTITLSGSASVFGATVTAAAVFSKTNILLTADLPEIKLFGDTGPVFKPGQLAWSSGPLTGFTPKVPSLPTIKAVNLTAKVPRINMAIAVPAEISGFAGSLVASVGDIALDGDVDFSTGGFSFAASMSNDTLDASGAISRAKTGDPYKYNLTGKIKKAIAMNSSVKLAALDFAFGNATAGAPVTFTGTGGVEVTLPDTTVLAMNGALTYKSATDFSVAITVGATGTSFPVNGGEALSLGTASGSLVRNATGTVLNLALSTAGPWKPVSGLSVSNVNATAALTCAVGATCVPTFNVTGTLGFDLGISGLNTANVTGSLTTAGFTFSATFGDLVFSTTGDIKLTAPTLSLSIPAKSSTDKASATLSGNFSLFGATVAGSMKFSSAGVLLVGTVPKFAFSGTDIGFDGGQFAWLLKAPANMSWTPTVPNLTIPAVSLSVATPKLLLSMPIPDAVKQLTATGGAAFGAISVGGDMNLATGAFSMNASYTSSNIDVSGSVSRADKATGLVYSLSVAVKAPTTIVDGVTVKSLTMSLGNATGSTVINGAGEITIGTTTDALTVGFALNYTSSTQYSFNISFKTGNSPTWTPFPGLTLPVGGITGSMARNGNTKTFTASFKNSSDWLPFPGVKIAEAGAGINATCTVGATCVLAFTATGKVSVDVGAGWQGPATLTGSFAKTESSLTATFPDITVTTGVVIKAPSLSLGYSSAKGISASISGSSDVLGTTLSMGATFSAQGVLVAGGMNDWTPVPGMTLANASFAFSTYAAADVVLPTSVSLGKVTVPKLNPTLLAGFSVPSWLRDLLKQPSLTVVPVSIPLKDLAGGKLPTIQIMLPTPDNWYMYKSGGSSMRFTALGFEVSGSPSPSMSLIGQTEMLTGASNETPVPLEIRGTVSPTRISLSLSLGKDKATGGPFMWKNAFGVTDLTLSEAAIQMGITLTAPMPLPSLGIAATAILPASWRSSLGMEAGVAVRLAANIDISQPCFSLQAGTLQSDNTTIAAGTAKVASIAGGVLTSTYMNLTIAPFGCQIGNVKYDPGVAANFVGTVFGTNVSVNAKIGTSPFSLEADMAIGAFNVGPVKLDETRMGVKISPTDNYISFAGGITIGSTKVSVSGKAGANTTDGPYLDMTGSIANLVIVPSYLEVRNATVTMNLKPLRGYANIIAGGSFNVLGTDATVALNMQMSNYQLQSLNASLQLQRTIAGVVTLNGNFAIAYTKGSVPRIDFSAAASMAGYNLGTASGFLDGNQVSITATASVGGVFSAQVSGQFVWQSGSGVNIVNRAGQTVAAAAGDFRIAATNIPMSLGGFPGSGNVVIGRAQNLVYGDFNANWSIGAGDVGGQVYVSGSFDTSGNFSFAGSGNLNLVAFNAAVSVSGSKNGNTWQFAMSSTINVMGAVSVGFSGNFYKSGSTTRFTMRGSADLRAAGIGGGRGNFRISNEPGQAGLYADVSINIAGVNGGGAMWVGADGTFDTSIWAGVNFPGVSAGGWVKIGNVAWYNGQRYRGNSYFIIDAWLNFAGVWFRMYGYINGDGSFQFTASAGPWSWGTYINAGFVQLSFGTHFASYITITSWAPYISIYIGGSAWMDWSWPECWWGGGRWSRYFRCGWGGWSRAINAGMGFNTNPGNVWINLWGYGFNIR